MIIYCLQLQFVNILAVHWI